jgi:putative glutamine amidotransferase
VVRRLSRAGAQTVLLPPGETDLAELSDWVLRSCHGLVITGGAFDIHPSHYGQSVGARIDRVDEGRTGLELGLATVAMNQGLPVLGICGGMQALAVAAGGSLIQDIATQIPGAIEHEQPTDPAEPWHSVILEVGILSRLVGAREIQVNSTHHQAVDQPGSLQITGRAPDGVVEVIEDSRHPFCLGLQWHPELLDDAPFHGLIEAAR